MPICGKENGQRSWNKFGNGHMLSDYCEIQSGSHCPPGCLAQEQARAHM